MFDPDSYFQSINRALKGCEKWADVDETPPKVERAYGKWALCVWDITIRFRDGSKLEATERHSRRAGAHYRKIRYRLEAPNGEMILLIDTHGNAAPIEDPPHAHLGPDQETRVEDGNPKLCGYSLTDYDFLKMWKITETYINGGGLPWSAIQ